jgi:CrcB protein
MLKLTLGVAVGSAIGGVLRVWLTHWAARTLPHHLPLGTILVNAAGSFAIGYVAAVATMRPPAFGGPMGHQVLMAGVLGGFTTFSAFSLDAVLLIERHAYWSAAAYVLGSVILSLAALFAGLSLYRIGAPLP